VAVSRHTYFVMQDPEDSGRRLFLRGRNSVAPPEQQGLGFRVEGKDIRLSNGKWANVASIKWDGTTDKSADEVLVALRGDKGGRPDNAREIAKDLLLRELKDGPKEASRLESIASTRAISKATLQRAADDLGVIKSGAKGRAAKSVWELPPQLVRSKTNEPASQNRLRSKRKRPLSTCCAVFENQQKMNDINYFFGYHSFEKQRF
jgi:hypothetical protein